MDRDIALPEKMTKFKKYLTSAKTGLNVSKMFTDLTTVVLNKIQRGELRADGTYGVKKGNASKGTRLKNNVD